MRVGIVPTKYGYTAVGLKPFDDEMNIEMPEGLRLPRDLKIQLRGQILQELARYCHEFAPFQGRLLMSFPWMLWSVAALATTSLWDAGLKYAILYGWIRFFFFADGIWVFMQALRQIKHLRQVEKIRNVVKSFGLSKITEIEQQNIHLTESYTEKDYIEAAKKAYPELEDYYNEMLRKEKPMIFRYVPLGLSGLAMRLFIGPKMEQPRLVFDLGKLE